MVDITKNRIWGFPVSSFLQHQHLYVFVLEPLHIWLDIALLS